jgi:hypothetical protein
MNCIDCPKASDHHAEILIELQEAIVIQHTLEKLLEIQDKIVDRLRKQNNDTTGR